MRNDTPRFKPLALALAASLFALSAQAETVPERKIEPKLQAGTVASTSSKAAAAEAAKAAAKDNATKVPGNASPAVPGVDTGRKDVVSGQPGGSKADATTRLSSPATEARANLAGQLNDSATNNPGFNQGFGQRQVNTDALNAAGAGIGGNPVTSLTGPADGGTGPTGIGAQGKGAISDGGFFSSDQGTIVLPNGEVRAPGRSAEAARDAAARIGATPDGVMKGVAPGATDPQMRCALNENDCADANASAKESTKPDKVESTKIDGGGEIITHTRSDGSTTTINRKKDGSATIITTDATGKVTKTEKIDANQKEVDTPSEEARFQPGKQEFLDNKLNDRNFQIKAAAKRDGAVNPDRGDGSAGAAVSGAVVPSQSAIGQNLFGNPGQSGGLREGGAPQGGLDFNDKKFGAIDLGPDATNTAGNRQQDAGDFFGGSQPSQGLPPRSTQDCDRDHRTADTADDCPAP
ncbi:hypothetical protein D0B54_23425 [Solimonas sp. K1W22B-7]|uniref:hypothetical protein n=1 Tax=Solimonas sp. K1W22B-7 TaxID=2303331 RepID=UPI000E33587C|nr:hypothetical protein [Solimonas sp. K1W22B-7]AXQ31453.1 hypothetical protein D0B54_23425 [Solimonas sp. K1W22B-7]